MANGHAPSSDDASPTSSPRPGGPRRLSPGLWMALTVATGIAGLLLVLELFVAQRIPPLTEEAFVAARDRWARRGPPGYDLDLELGGARPGTVHVEVRDGEVVAMSRDGVTPNQRRTWEVWSVPGQFETIGRELELAADPAHEMELGDDTQLVLRCEFDAQYGYPRQFHRIVYGGGPEVYWKVIRFEQL